MRILAVVCPLLLVVNGALMALGGLHMALTGRAPWPGRRFWLPGGRWATGATVHVRILGWATAAWGAAQWPLPMVGLAAGLDLVPESLALAVTLLIAALALSVAAFIAGVVLRRRAIVRPDPQDPHR